MLNQEPGIDYSRPMKTVFVFALAFFTSSFFVFGQESDEENAVLQTERDLAVAYLNSDADAIAEA